MLAPGWDLFDRFLGLSDFSPFEINLKWNPEDPLTWGQDYLILFWRWYQVSIWRAFRISSPNLVTMRLPKESSQTPNRLLTPDGGTSNPKTVSMKDFGWWHQFSIWRAVQISSPNLVTDRLLTDSSLDKSPMNPWLTPEFPPNGPKWTKMNPRQALIGSLVDLWWTPMDPDGLLTKPLMNPRLTPTNHCTMDFSWNPNQILFLI